MKMRVLFIGIEFVKKIKNLKNWPLNSQERKKIDWPFTFVVEKTRYHEMDEPWPVWMVYTVVVRCHVYPTHSRAMYTTRLYATHTMKTWIIFYFIVTGPSLFDGLVSFGGMCFFSSHNSAWCVKGSSVRVRPILIWTNITVLMRLLF